MTTATTIPSYEPDLYSDDALLEPYEHYRALRELGPVVHLSATDLLHVPRYAEVREVLGDTDRFVSGQGVCLNPMSNAVAAGASVLNMDGPEHTQYRQVLAGRLTPKALRPLREPIEAQADALVRSLLERGRIDAVADLATALPLSIVPDLIGWPAERRGSLLDWAGALFDLMGPANDRAVASLGPFTDLQSYAQEVAQRRDLAPGSVGHDVLRRADEGEFPVDRCPMLLVDFLGPSLDTTISAIGTAVQLLATHPEQWERLRADPSLVARTFNEVVRLESPISGFSRVAARDTDLGGVPLAAGDRLVVSYASANRDERHWGPTASTFDITRDSSTHLGLGHGEHGCAGQGLARLETHAVLAALVRHVARIEPAGAPQRGLNNLIRAWSSVPVTLVPA